MGYRADYTHLLQNLVRAHPQGAVEFAKKLVSNESGPLIETQAVVDIFLSLNRVQETTAFLLEALKGNKPGEGPLQTKLLEIILLSGNPQFAEAILQNEMFSHYDRAVVAKLCEQAGLFQVGRGVGGSGDIDGYVCMYHYMRVCVVSLPSVRPSTDRPID